jgi:Domain of unknown function (DUF6899)
VPYITQQRRNALTDTRRPGQNLPPPDTPKNAGELNYKITILLHAYLREHGLKYQHINDCIGALEGAKLELYRRVAARYETLKMKENGDIKL